MCGLREKIRIGMAEMIVVKNPAVIITTVGSCVALCMYDLEKKIGGMAHIVLPKKEDVDEDSDSVPKYADTAVPALLFRLISKGAKRENIKAKIAGGANMFPNLENPILKIGEKNVKAVKEKLIEMGIPLIAEDIGGNHGRVVEFEVRTGMVKVNNIYGRKRVL